MARSPDDIKQVMQTLDAFKAQGFDPFPLKHWSSTNTKTGKPNGNTPRDLGWKHADYSQFQFADWLEWGGNVGWRLQPDQLVIDVDPRNGGWDGVARLTWDLGGLEIFNGVPRVLSGREDGGTHFYFNKPMLTPTRTTWPGYPGVDFKKGPGQYVLVPGALHYRVGQPYWYDPSYPIEGIAQAPEALIELIKAPGVPAFGQGGGGEVSNEELARLLDALDPTEFGQGRHQEWLSLAMACHDATNGDGMMEWLAWCARDPMYGDDATEQNTRRWLSFEAGKMGTRATMRTLFHYVIEAGRKDLVKELGWARAADDFANDDPDLEWGK